MIEYTDPHIFLYCEQTIAIYVMDDFGNATRVPGVLFYGFHPSMTN